jgi:LysM repeat protein
MFLLADQQASAAVGGNSCGFSAAPPSAQISASGSYEVRPGDTLTNIAATHSTTVEALLEANSIRDPNLLEVGTRLKLGSGPTPSSSIIGRATLVTGVLVDCHAACRTILAQDNKIYALSGEMKGLSSGDVVEVEGAFSSSPECAPIQTLSIKSVRPAPYTGWHVDRGPTETVQTADAPTDAETR